LNDGGEAEINLNDGGEAEITRGEAEMNDGVEVDMGSEMFKNFNPFDFGNNDTGIQHGLDSNIDIGVFDGHGSDSDNDMGDEHRSDSENDMDYEPAEDEIGTDDIEVDMSGFRNNIDIDAGWLDGNNIENNGVESPLRDDD